MMIRFVLLSLACHGGLFFWWFGLTNPINAVPVAPFFHAQLKKNLNAPALEAKKNPIALSPQPQNNALLPTPKKKKKAFPQKAQPIEKKLAQSVEKFQNAPNVESAPQWASNSISLQGLSDFRPASILKKTKPQYPLKSRLNNEEGEVLLKIWLNAQGKIEKMQVQQSSGFARLDESAQKAVALFAFSPAQQNGQPIASVVHLPIRFELKGF